MRVHRLINGFAFSILYAVLLVASLSDVRADSRYFDAAGGTLARGSISRCIYFFDQQDNVLWRTNLDGSERTALLTLDSNPWGVDLDPTEEKIYWTQSDKIVRANMDGTNVEVLWNPGFIGLKGMAVDVEEKKLYFFDQQDNVLWRTNLDGSERTTLLTLDSNPWSVDLDPTEEKIYWTQSDKIVRANMDGTNVEVLWNPGFIGLKGMALIPIPEPATLSLLVLGALAILCLKAL